ncbi:MAG: C40 family peptidase [Gemmatimonadota bacterium]
MLRQVRLLLALALVGSVASVAAAQDSGPLTALQARGSNPDGPVARRLASSDAVVAKAREQLGKRYRTASASPDHGFDCSGLVKYVLNAFGVDLPHNAARIAREGEAVSADTSSLLPGDLLMFGRGRSARISHVGIYVGEGKMIHASTAQRRVIETALPSSMSTMKLRTVRRVL